MLGICMALRDKNCKIICLVFSGKAYYPFWVSLLLIPLVAAV